MKKILVLSALFFGQLAFANETTSYEVKGMHCGGCRALIKKEFCALDSLETCDVKLLPNKKNTGMITYSLKTGKTLDEATIAATIQKAGEEYSLDSKTKKTTK